VVVGPALAWVHGAPARFEQAAPAVVRFVTPGGGFHLSPSWRSLFGNLHDIQSINLSSIEFAPS
jgi:hypothetical protein